MLDPLEWCVLCWHLVVIYKDNHPYIIICLSSVDSLFRYLDHAHIINPPPIYFRFILSVIAVYAHVLNVRLAFWPSLARFC